MAAPPQYLKLFVSGIPSTCSEAEFQSLIQPFAKNAPIKELKFFERVVSDSCYAFIEFGNAADGQMCCQALQSMPIHGVYIRAGLATKKIQATSPTNLYVEGIPPEWKDADLGNFFSKFGQIEAARILVDKITNASREVGFVHFTTPEDAQAAMDQSQGNPPYEGAKRVFQLKFANQGREMNGFGGGGMRGGRGRGRGRGGGRGRGRGRGGGSNLASVVCKFFVQGQCNKGGACPFSHGGGGYGNNFSSNNFNGGGYGGGYGGGGFDNGGYQNGGFQDQFGGGGNNWGGQGNNGYPSYPTYPQQNQAYQAAPMNAPMGGPQGNQYNPAMASGGYGPSRGGGVGNQWGPY